MTTGPTGNDRFFDQPVSVFDVLQDRITCYAQYEKVWLYAPVAN